LTALAAAAFLSAATTSIASACENAGKTPSELTLEEARRAVRCLINKKRHNRGVKRLRSNGPLEQAAQGHSQAMESGKFFSHYSPDGTSPSGRIQSSGYTARARRWRIAENIGWGEGRMGSPRETVRTWMRSASHRDALLSRSYRHLGVGFVVGSPERSSGDAAIYTVDFGNRK
jgi:uncharacterized protein YkwD